MITNTCPGCKTKVYPIDKSINLDGKVYHNPCAKCSDCSCQLTLSNAQLLNHGGDNYELLCKTHHQARIGKGAGYGDEDKFQGKTKEGGKQISITNANKCKVCEKSLYPAESQMNIDGSFVHKTCAKCMDCDTQITLTNMAFIKNTNEFVLLCKTHYSKRISDSGGAHPGGSKYNVKNVRDLRAAEIAEIAKDPIRSPTDSGDKSFDFTSRST